MQKIVINLILLLDNACYFYLLFIIRITLIKIYFQKFFNQKCQYAENILLRDKKIHIFFDIYSLSDGVCHCYLSIYHLDKYFTIIHPFEFYFDRSSFDRLHENSIY